MLMACKIVGTVGIIMHICKIQKGRDIAVGSSIVAITWEIIKAVI
ncbi:hypothetical protein [Niameybacter massiliensis]|nr:hypothetical protein [Niameybacter massiliensis]